MMERRRRVAGGFAALAVLLLALATHLSNDAQDVHERGGRRRLASLRAFNDPTSAVPKPAPPGPAGAHSFSPLPLVLPNVLLIGAQKAGTTSLANWLMRAGVCGPLGFDGKDHDFDSDKEVHFFDQRALYAKGIQYYAKYFDHCKEAKYVMDATPETLQFPLRVHESYSSEVSPHEPSELKLMLILREPLEREMSRFNHMKDEYLKTKRRDQWYSEVARADGAVMSFEEYAASFLARVISRNHSNWQSRYARYVDHIRQYDGLFGPDRLLVLSYHELQRDPEKFLWRVQEFLGGDDAEEGIRFGDAELPRSNVRMHSGKLKTVPEGVKRTLGPGFAKKNAELYDYLELTKDERPLVQQQPFERFKEP